MTASVMSDAALRCARGLLIINTGTEQHELRSSKASVYLLWVSVLFETVGLLKAKTLFNKPWERESAKVFFADVKQDGIKHLFLRRTKAEVCSSVGRSGRSNNTRKVSRSDFPGSETREREKKSCLLFDRVLGGRRCFSLPILFFGKKVGKFNGPGRLTSNKSSKSSQPISCP